MKRLLLYVSVTMLIVIVDVSCDKILDEKPPNIVSSSEVFSDKNSVNNLIVTLYSELPMLAYTGYSPTLQERTQETVAPHGSNFQGIIGDGTQYEWWDDGYAAIRDVNKFIANVKKADYKQEQINQWLGEALFIRAYNYFGLVKRYGGIPLITKVQNYTGDNLSELQLPREKEKKIYDFISTQLDSAITLMGSKSPAAGRANKYVALALKSRAMTFAASEAEYANVQLNGVLGIPSKYADQYWKQAYNAAEKIIKSGKYSLYNKYPNDPVKNFDQLFLDTENNPEVIFAKYYSYPDIVHYFDRHHLPFEYESPAGYSSADSPTVQLAESFNYKDGSDGKLKIRNGQGEKIEYKKPVNLFKNKDPRFFASIIVPFSEWRGKTVHVRAGIVTAPGDTLTSGRFSSLYKGMHIIGASGLGGGELSLTGLYMRKHLNPALAPSRTASGSAQPWIEFRLGGVLLNYAEAAAELGRKADVAKAINKLHARADVSPIKTSQLSIQTVRHERKVELMGENKYYWDMRRWRIADKILDNRRPKALYPYYVWQDKAYIFKIVKINYPETFLSKMYYKKIPQGEINKNPNLKQNPGY